MKSGLTKAAFWSGAVACMSLATLAAAAQQKPANPAGPSAAEAAAAKGEDLMNVACLSCHEIRPIQTQALDKDSWTKKVQSMIEKGAQVKPTELPVLVDYLVTEYGPVPDGAGKPILLNICTQCHSLDRIKHHTATKEEWDGTLNAMLNEGAPLSDEDYPVILNYLARNFRPKN